jgi:hypothetical protein
LVSSKLSILEKDYISELFLDTEGNPYYILPHIILSIDDNISIKDVLKGYSGILTVDPVQRLKGMYTISCTRTTATDVLKIVSELETRVGVEWYMPRDWSLTYSTLPPSLPQAGLKVFISSKPR